MSHVLESVTASPLRAILERATIHKHNALRSGARSKRADIILWCQLNSAQGVDVLLCGVLIVSRILWLSEEFVVYCLQEQDVLFFLSLPPRIFSLTTSNNTLDRQISGFWSLFLVSSLEPSRSLRLQQEFVGLIQSCKSRLEFLRTSLRPALLQYLPSLHISSQTRRPSACLFNLNLITHI